MPIAFVAVTKIEHSTGNVASGPVTSTAANALICCAHTYNNSTSTGTITISGAGGTWTNDVSGSYTEFTSNKGDVCISSTPSNSGGTNTITATESVSVAAGIVAIIYEFSGMATSSMKDVAGTLNTGNSSTPTTNSLTNINANDVFIAMVGEGGSGSSGVTGNGGSGSGTWVFPAGGAETNGASFPVVATGYDIVSATGAQNPSWTLGAGASPWATLIACYKAPAAAANPEGWEDGDSIVLRKWRAENRNVIPY